MTCRESVAMAFVSAALCACAHASQQPDVVGAQRSLAMELLQRRDWAAAFSVADGLCRTAPDQVDGFYVRGVVYRERGLFTEAEGDLKEALSIDSRSARSHSALAILYDSMNRSKEALEHHRRAAELEPQNANYLNNLGFSLFVQGRPRDAIPVLEQAVRANPIDHRIRNNLGFAHAAAGDLTRAAEQFRYGGTPAEAKTNLGWAYERRGALTQAYEMYVQALREDPGSAEARKNLTRVAQELGREPPHDLAATPGA